MKKMNMKIKITTIIRFPRIVRRTANLNSLVEGFVIIWVLPPLSSCHHWSSFGRPPPSPSSDDVIYEQPLTVVIIIVIIPTKQHV